PRRERGGRRRVRHRELRVPSSGLGGGVPARAPTSARRSRCPHHRAALSRTAGPSPTAGVPVRVPVAADARRHRLDGAAGGSRMSGGGMSGADGAQPRDPGTDAPRAQRFVGRTALVTGASSGIGAGVARRLAAEGATVILLGRDESRLAQVRASLTGQDRAHRTVTAELGDPASITAAAQAVRDAGKLHVLVHSAGVFGPQPFAEISVETLDRVWAVNVRAPFLLTQALLPMLRRGSAIVFVSSVSGRVGMIGQSAYGTSKSAVDGLART